MKHQIVTLLKDALKKLKINLSNEEISEKIEIPPSSEMGDFAFPCFFLAAKLKNNPNKIAVDLKEKIGKQKKFERVEVKGAYINFFMNKKDFTESVLKEVFKEKNNYGKQNIGKGKKALIEHTSINPNASPHVGRARNAIIGDSIVKILEFINFKPEVHYYVNNVSKQIALLVLAKAEKLKFDKMLKKYGEISKKVSESDKLEKQVFEIIRKFEGGDKEILEKFDKITKTCVEGQKKILSDMGINYDFFDYESGYMEKGNEIIEKLKKTGKISKDEEGRFVLDLNGSGIENKIKSPILVLTRSNGTGLYILRDIAYTIDKIKKAETNIIVLGEDQKLYFEQISYALKLLNYKSPKVVHYSFILLSKQGKMKKMSTRSGDVVLLEDFLKEAEKKSLEKTKNKKIAKEISISAVKYSILKNNPNKIINFNLEESISFEGNTGPYLLYTYARANSILKKVKSKKSFFPKKELNEKEYELVKKISQFRNIISSAYENLDPSFIANYSYELAKSFNEFYHESKVVNSDEEAFRIALVEATKMILENSLKLLGIETVEKM